MSPLEGAEYKYVGNSSCIIFKGQVGLSSVMVSQYLGLETRREGEVWRAHSFVTKLKVFLT